jgi:zinc protease
MFKGSRRFNREGGTAVARVLQRVGAQFNATTWLDRTNYYATLPSDRLELAVEIEADRMRGALVRDEDLRSERTVVLNELDRGENEPFEVLLRTSFAHAYLEHPYRHPTIGYRGDVEALSATVLRDFYDTFYHPDNATVIVVGEIDEEGALEVVDRHFGPIPPSSGPIPGVVLREGPQRGECRFQVHRAAELGSMMLSWRIPEGLHPDLPPLQVLAQVLAEGVTSRLYQSLVETNRCLGVQAMALELHDPGLFQVSATLAPGVEHGEVEQAIRDEVTRLSAEPPRADELLRAKVQVRADLAFARESPAQIVAVLTESVAMGDWRRCEREMDLLSAVSGEDVRRVAGAYLSAHNLTAGWLVPDRGEGGPVPLPRRPGPCNLLPPFSERVEQFELPGGARLAVLPNPHSPTVTIGATVRAGVACEPDGRYTVPGVTAAMLERGSQRHTRLELARELEDHGLQLHVESSGSFPTTVAVAGHGLAEELPRLARLMVEVLRTPTFPADELAKVRERMLGGLARERQETFPQALAAFTRLVYPDGHPHRRRPLEVRERELESLGREDLVEFHASAYGPGSLMMGVVGDVAAGEVRDLFGGLLADWGGGLLPLPSAPASVMAAGQRELVPLDDRPNLDVFLGHAGQLLVDDDDHAAAVLANSCLGQSTLTSRLGTAVRDDAGLTYGVVSRFFCTLHLPGPWAIALSVSRGDLDRAEALCREVVTTYVAEGPGEEELDDERQALSGSFRVALATNGGVARQLVVALTAGLPVSFLDDYPQRLLDTSRDQVVAALRRHIRPERLVLSAAGSLNG